MKCELFGDQRPAYQKEWDKKDHGMKVAGLTHGLCVKIARE